MADSGGFVPIARRTADIRILLGNGIMDKYEPPFFGIAALIATMPTKRSVNSDASLSARTPPIECATMTNL
ncbi:hypothetical protein D3C87_1894530 [compost metagenome]